MKKILISLCLLSYLSVKAQQRECILKVTDEAGIPVAGVYILMNNLSVGFTDEYGVFKIDKTSFDTLYLTHLVYEPRQVTISTLQQDTNYIHLKERFYELSEVNVVSQRASTIIKEAFNHFKRHYRLSNYWAKCQYRQAIRYQNKYRSYMECRGYSYMPVLAKNIFASLPKIVPQQVRRTREDVALQKFCFVNNIRYTLLRAPSYMMEYGDYAYLEEMHPLNKWEHNKYRFSPDTIDTQPNNTEVFLFRQKQNKFSVVGRIIHECNGKIWIDKETGHIRKIFCTFYRNAHFNRIEVEYTEIEGDIFPKSINMELIHNLSGRRGKIEQVFVESEIKFPEIDRTPRPNYLKHNGLALDYSFISILDDYKYQSKDWEDNSLSNHWKEIIRQITPDPVKEFSLGSEEKAWNQSSELKKTSNEFVRQMKKDLNLK